MWKSWSFVQFYFGYHSKADLFTSKRTSSVIDINFHIVNNSFPSIQSDSLASFRNCLYFYWVFYAWHLIFLNFGWMFWLNCQIEFLFFSLQPNACNWSDFLKYTFESSLVSFYVTLIRLEVHSEPYQTSTIEFYAKTIYVQNSILDVWQRSEHASENVA